jgi:hypothetical protein
MTLHGICDALAELDDKALAGRIAGNFEEFLG